MKPSNLHRKRRAYWFGIYAEWLVIVWLCVRGYQILKRRYRNHMGEIDIIAARGKTLVMVEVKARKDKTAIYEVLTDKQRARITRAAELFLAEFRSQQPLTVRFDVMLVTPFRLPHRIKQAW